ncbi:tyrosine-protein phosphatase [Bacillus horti]|uniref:Tyrosine-protein phosphatase n=1 Tax=Caldalkalibacillus horti TaxID=77523 RepID=A0ABT9VZG7_9BACI|nr:CpsB/CapC family capsule biosynthesis tyrosine phosphatase [Bacillus horti]MDQ0166381.1 protein-tyrosine phosphatase [Bacillus horti]
MIDIHSHILYGVDDGPRTLGESLELAAEATANGIRQIIATPHHKNGVYDNPKQSVLELVEEFQRELDRQQIPLTVYPGQEVHVYDSILEDIHNHELLTLDKHHKYLLLELPNDSVPPFMEELLYDIQLLGVTPIIPHPERNVAIRKRPSMLYQMIRKGALAQITAASVVGKFGKGIQKFSFQCIEHNLCHMIASDAHKAGKRGFHLQDAYKVIRKKFGIDVEHQLLRNTEWMMNGVDMYVNPPQKIERKSTLATLLKRK